MKSRIKRDITIRFIPNLLADEGRTLQSFPYDRRWTIRRYLRKAKVNFEGMRIMVNGNAAKSLRQHLQSGDEIVVIPEIGIALGFAVPWFIDAFVFYATAAIAIAITVYSIYSALTTKVKTPSYDISGEGIDEDSPSASWTGVKTVRDPNGSIPIIYGRRLTGGTVINEFISTDGEKNYLNSLVAIGEGPLKSITLSRINKNAAENFSNYTLETKLGTNDQVPISNFEDLHDIHSLSVELEKDAAYTYTSEISDLEAFEIILGLPNGLYQQDSSGNLTSWDVTFKVEYKLHSAGEWTDLGGTTISGKTRSTLQKIFRKDGLTAGQYDIRITRTSDNSSLDPVKNGDLYLQGVDEINTDNLSYPNTGVVGIKTLAINELSGDRPEYEFLTEARLVLVPKIMNGAAEVDWEDYYWDPDAGIYKLLADDTALTWDGETYVERFSANPIWCLYDLMTNTRFGLGDYITTSDHDLDYLLEMSQYCEERVPDGEGGYEKRFRMDVCIDSPQQALNLIMQLCGIFRGMPFYSDLGKVRIAIDKPDNPVQLFNMGNIVKDSFSQSWGSKRDIPNIVHVQFDNEDNYYEQEMISVIDEESLVAGDPKRIKQVRYYGTKLSYAIRFGRNILKTAKYVNRTITIKAGTAALIRQCGEVIDIAHDVPQWGFSGCVLSGSTTTKVKLDRTIEIEAAKSYAIRVDFAQLNEDGSPRYEERVVTDPPGSYTEVNVSEAFSSAPLKNDSYSFGELNKLVLPARIVSLKRQRGGEVEIEVQEYNEDIYDDTAVTIPVRESSSLSPDTPDVTDLQLTERIAKLTDGSIEDVIDVWFQRPVLTTYKIGVYQKARIYLSDNNGASWEYKGETNDIHFAIIGGLKDGVTYTVAVVSIAANGKENPVSTSPSTTINLIGKSAAPSDVTTFLVNQSRDRLYFGWTNVTDVDLKGYEIRYGNDWASGYVIVSDKKGNSHIELNFREGSAQKFFIKAIDTSGNYSENATEATVTIDNIPFTNIIESYQEQTGWAGTKSNTTKVGDNLEISDGQLSGTYITPEQDVGYVATFKIGIETVVTAAGDREFDDDEEARFSDSETSRMSGEEISGAVSFEIRTSEDNITWTDWAAWQAGDYKCRYFQLRMTMTRASLSQDLECSEFNYYADLPDVDEFSEDEVTDAGAGKEVLFTKDFHEAPSVNIDILTGDGFVHKFSAIPDLTGFTVKLYKLDGTAVTGQFKYHAHAV
ncbi:MAG: phage tail protein [Candidatus Omnitrophica bacterium]|nr:phage tail protein [Candidatus Omnitrophota bacterium]MDD5592642.1 phage tail protein [Candidatus Omnitrophota bacterium]